MKLKLIGEALFDSSYKRLEKMEKELKNKKGQVDR